jgi:hypothetical protein
MDEDESKALAGGIAGIDWEMRSDVPDDEVREAPIRLIRSRSLDGVGIGLGGTTVVDGETFAAYRDAHIRPAVDLRKAPHPERRFGAATCDVGTLRYNGAGEIVGHEIDPEYRCDGASDEGDDLFSA